MLLCITTLFAQQSVTGRVTGANGAGIPGVSVTVVGTNKAAQTDAAGNYTIEASNGQTIRFTSVGLQPLEITVSSNTHNVNLQEDESNIDEVVVTAMGIKREKRSLGYSFQEVQGTTLTDARENNIANALAGKVSNLQVVKDREVQLPLQKLSLEVLIH